jgi:hypothetical protein
MLPIMQAPQPQPQPGVAAAPHLQAFGLPQVAAASHIHNSVSNVFSGSGPASFSFFDGMSSGLAPPIAGQDGPTLEQLLTRNLKSWKPFTNDDDFKEALNDWLSHVTGQLALGSDNAAFLRATISYITMTLGYLSSYGHKLVYKYHKAVMQAMRKVPPLYDPLLHGPTYTQAYLENLYSASDSSAKRSSQSTSQRNRRQTAAPRRDNAKRARSEQPCEIHPGSSHSNGECRSQQTSKRPAQNKRSAAASASDD